MKDHVFCVNCGAQVASTVKFCPDCGAEIVVPLDEESVKQSTESEVAQQPDELNESELDDQSSTETTSDSIGDGQDQATDTQPRVSVSKEREVDRLQDFIREVVSKGGHFIDQTKYRRELVVVLVLIGVLLQLLGTGSMFVYWTGTQLVVTGCAVAIGYAAKNYLRRIGKWLAVGLAVLALLLSFLGSQQNTAIAREIVSNGYQLTLFGLVVVLAGLFMTISYQRNKIFLASGLTLLWLLSFFSGMGLFSDHSDIARAVAQIALAGAVITVGQLVVQRNFGTSTQEAASMASNQFSDLNQKMTQRMSNRRMHKQAQDNLNRAANAKQSVDPNQQTVVSPAGHYGIRIQEVIVMLASIAMVASNYYGDFISFKVPFMGKTLGITLSSLLEKIGYVDNGTAEGLSTILMIAPIVALILLVMPLLLTKIIGLSAILVEDAAVGYLFSVMSQYDQLDFGSGGASSINLSDLGFSIGIGGMVLIGSCIIGTLCAFACLAKSRS